MIILGLDPGLATTGFGIIEIKRGYEPKALEWGVIVTKKNKTLTKRLADIAEDVFLLIEKWKPKIAVVESIFFSTNAKTAINVAQARGVIIYCLEHKKISIKEFTPLQTKSRITGYGAATKKQIQFMVKKLLKLTHLPKPDDAADALALALCGGL